MAAMGTGFSGSEDDFAEMREALMLRAEARRDLDMWTEQRELHRMEDEDRKQGRQPRGGVGSVSHYPLVDLLMS